MSCRSSRYSGEALLEGTDKRIDSLEEVQWVVKRVINLSGGDWLQSVINVQLSYFNVIIKVSTAS